jgi:hypothetical protein
VTHNAPPLALVKWRLYVPSSISQVPSSPESSVLASEAASWVLASEAASWVLASAASSVLASEASSVLASASGCSPPASLPASSGACPESPEEDDED